MQARTVSRWIRELAKVTRVAICSGNHDNAGRQISADRAPVYEWLYELGKDPRIIADGSTEVLDDLILTTVPYDCNREQKVGLAGSRSEDPAATREPLASIASCSSDSLSGVFPPGGKRS